MKIFNKISKRQMIELSRSIFLIILGTFLLAFGTVIFLTKSELVAGGVSGIAIIIQHYVKIDIYDFLVLIIQAILFIVGFIFVGKSFALKSLLSSILYIGFTFLFKRVPFFIELANEFAGKNPTVGNWLICGLFGGVFIGAGVAITFLGGGSTGGVDCFQPILKKHFNIPEAVTSFIIDAIVIIVGMITMRQFVNSLCGILSAFVSAVLIEVVFSRSKSSYVVDIISDKWEEINTYSIDVLERSSTIIDVVGGYTQQDRKLVRIVLDKTQYDKVRNYIATIDPNAFITFTETKAVYGEGFKRNKKTKNKKK